MTDTEHIQIDIADYKPHPRNYNEHPDPQIGEIAESLRVFGQVKPVVVWREWYIAGHGVVLGAQRLGWTQLKAERLPADWPEYKALAYLAADNELARGASPNLVALAALAKEVQAEDAGMGRLAAGGEDGLRRLAALMGEPAGEDAGPQIDRAEELREKWGVQVGQMWQLGEHRVICGDCREPATWERLLGGVKANGVFTSPPYAEQRKEQYGGVPADEYVEWWEAVQGNVKANLAGDGSFFVNIKPHCEDGERVLYVFDLALAMCRRWGWRYVDELCWSHQGVPGYWPNRFKNGFEPVYHFAGSREPRFRPKQVSEKKSSAFKGKGGGLNSYYDPDNSIEHSTESFFGDVLPANILRLNFPSATSEFTSHGAQFPVALPDFFIRAYSDAGDVWVDPFCGSGTVIIAAHNNKRRGMGIELLPKYVAVILQRWADLTGGEPVLVED